MDALTFFKERSRMTNNCSIDCDNCLIAKNKYGVYCAVLEIEHPEETIAIVEKWSKEHPRKTYLTDLLEKYPNIDLANTGEPKFLCPHDLGYMPTPKNGRNCSSHEDCIKCWNTLMEG